MKILSTLVISSLLMGSLGASRIPDGEENKEKVRPLSRSKSGSMDGERTKKKRDRSRFSLPLAPILSVVENEGSTFDSAVQELGHGLSKLSVKSDVTKQTGMRAEPWEHLTFWEAYTGIKQNKVDKAPWIKIKGPLLKRIVMIGDQWQIETLDREPTPDVMLFHVQKKQVKKVKHETKMRAEYTLPLPYDNYTGEESLVVYFEIPQEGASAFEPKESKQSVIKSLLAWQQGENGKNLMRLQDAALSSTPLTPHDPSACLFRNKTPEEFLRLQYNVQERRLSIVAHKFRQGELATLLPYFPHDMCVLELEGTSLRKSDAAVLAPYMSETLQTVNLSRNRLGDMAFMSLSPSFTKSLKILDISDNNLGDVALIALAENLSPMLETLLIGRNAITNKGMRVLARHLTMALHKLDLHHTQIDDEVADAFHQATHLPIELIVSHTGVGDNFVHSLLEHESKRLITIHLNAAKLGGRGATTLNEGGFVEAFPSFLKGVWVKK